MRNIHKSWPRVYTLLNVFILFTALLMGLGTAVPTAANSTALPAKTGKLWSPYVEWSLENPSFNGNPYDLVATVTFVHSASQETRTTEMFYADGSTWKFRFAGTKTGLWTFTTSSSDGDLNGRTGQVTINPDPDSPGFVTNFDNKWGRTGTLEAFVPQYVMVSGPQNYYNNANRINAEIQTFINEHGFNGFHSPVFCRWFDINQPTCSQISGASPNPDPRTFAALEMLITEVYNAGGVVHLWMWGDSQRQQNPNFLPGGVNGPVDQRLQRYIAARLGPLPGWTMGYGFDLFEWTTSTQLNQWHNYMIGHLGWEHFLGARSSKNQLNQLSEAMEYSSYEQHRPDYDMYVDTIEARPTKPSFSEDRFRIGNGHPYKDYNMEMTRRGLWQSAMAGGVANIWGNLLTDDSANDGTGTSLPYPNPEWIKTYSLFFAGRFFLDMERCNSLTNGVCLTRPNQADFLFYRENTTSIRLDLSGMRGSQVAVVVDAKRPYQEISLGTLSAQNQTWTAPYASDWAIAVGEFSAPACIPSSYGQQTGGVNNPLSTTALPYHTYLPLVVRGC